MFLWSLFFLLEWQMVSSSVFNKLFKSGNTFPSTRHSDLPLWKLKTCCRWIFLWSVIPDCRLHIVPACLDKPVDCSYLLLGAFSWLVELAVTHHSTSWLLPVNRTSLPTASFYLNPCSLRLSTVVLSLCGKVSSSFPHFVQISIPQYVVWRL